MTIDSVRSTSVRNLRSVVAFSSGVSAGFQVYLASFALQYSEHLLGYEFSSTFGVIVSDLRAVLPQLDVDEISKFLNKLVAVRHRINPAVLGCVVEELHNVTVTLPQRTVDKHCDVHRYVISKALPPDSVNFLERSFCNFCARTHIARMLFGLIEFPYMRIFYVQTFY